MNVIDGSSSEAHTGREGRVVAGKLRVLGALAALALVVVVVAARGGASLAVLGDLALGDVDLDTGHVAASRESAFADGEAGAPPLDAEAGEP